MSRAEIFDEIMLPHLDAAHNLARWLMRNDDDARDVVQEAYLRAFRFFDGYRGGDGKAWLLEIVRNTCRTFQRRQAAANAPVPFDETTHTPDAPGFNAEEKLAGEQDIGMLRNCIAALPEQFREVLVLRELEEMSYHEIAALCGLAIGTVMSRLSRARKRLQECAARRRKEAAG